MREDVRGAVRTALLALVPAAILVALGSLTWANRRFYLVSLLMLVLALVPMLLRFERRAPQARELVPLAVLVALGAAGRAAFAFAPAFKPVAAIVIVAGAAFGCESGFVVGAMTAFISNFYFGQGPWTPWQMLGFGLVGFFAGLLFARRARPSLLSLCVYGALSVALLYGPLLDVGSVLMVTGDVTRAAILTALGTGVTFNLAHAFATVVFLALAGLPLLKKINKVKIKYGVGETDDRGGAEHAMDRSVCRDEE